MKFFRDINKSKIITVIKWAIGIGLFSFVLFVVEPKEIYTVLTKGDAISILFAAGLMPINLFVQFYKWKVLSTHSLGISDNRTSFLSLMYGIMGGMLTPMKSGEFVARALPYSTVEPYKVMLVTVVDKTVPLFFVAVLGGISALWYMKDGWELSLSAILFLAAVYLLLIAAGIVLLTRSSILQRISRRLKTYRTMRPILERLSFIAAIPPSVLLLHGFLSLIFHLTFVSQMSILLIAYSGTYDFLFFFYISNLVIFVQTLLAPLALGEFGVREGAAVYFLTISGYAGAVGFNAAFSLFLINIVLPSLIGSLLLFKRS